MCVLTPVYLCDLTSGDGLHVNYGGGSVDS